MTDKDKAIQEAERIAAADEYFKARAWLMDTNDNRRIFEAGFERAYALLSKLRAPVADERAAFEAWAEGKGLIQKSHGIMSVDSQCDLAREAWQAGRAALAIAPVATTTDRAMLQSVLQDLVNSDSVCPRCGHSDSCADMDVAHMIRDHLKSNASAPVAGEPCKRCGGPGWYTSHTTGYPESIPCSACNPEGASVERLAKDPFLAAQLWRKPADFADAYEGAREDLAIWKRRALEAERDLRAERETSSRLAAALNAENGPTHLGAPAPQASEAVRDALVPFAALEDADLIGTAFEGKGDDAEILHFHRTGKSVTLGDFRRARAALSAQPSGNPGELAAQPGAQKEQSE